MRARALKKAAVKAAAKPAIKKASKDSAKKGGTGKRVPLKRAVKNPAAPSKKSAVKRRPAKAKKAKPNDGKWSSGKRCLERLKADGYALSEQNLYAHYGNRSSHPVERNGKKQWNYEELKVRVEYNRDKNSAQLGDSASSAALARQVATTRLQVARAGLAERKLRVENGDLLAKSALASVLTHAKVSLEDRRRKLVSTLVEDLGLDGHAKIVVDEQTRDWLAGINGVFSWWRERPSDDSEGGTDAGGIA